MTNIPKKAVQWALSKVGCAYSQPKRTQENIFDCSSLVARAYSAQGKKWLYGGSVPISMYEVYDDDFELIWPENYADIGKRFGGNSVIKSARRAGDLQFICTDNNTKRANRITHVAMVCDEENIVHARSSKYGVCKNAISLYSGKICAVVRYNPEGVLRLGMCGWRTLALQKKLNEFGAALSEDGEFGAKTRDAVIGFQKQYGLEETGRVDVDMIELLNEGKVEKPGIDSPELRKIVRVTGSSVNIRRGPGTEYDVESIAVKNDIFPTVEQEDWIPIECEGAVCWINKAYVKEEVSK